MIVITRKLVMVVLGAALVSVACGSAGNVGVRSSPSPGTSGSASTSGGQSPAATPSATATVSPTSTDAWKLVIADYNKNQVRLARLDAVDVAAVTGTFDGVAGGHAIVINGQTLLAIAQNGKVSTLGHLAGKPEDTGPGTVAVNPTLTQWVYTLFDFSDFVSHIHLGSANGDRVIASVPPPSDATYYQPLTWNPSGVYMVKEPTGLGGAGPFLDYHVPLVTLDVGTGQVTAVSPECIGEDVLDDGTLLCRSRTAGGGLEVRSPNGSSHVVQVATGTSGMNGAYTRVVISADERGFIAVRNGSADPNVVNYQMAAADFTATKATTFGAIDFYPEAYLPDGRVVASHQCWSDSCSQSLDGTYVFSADGKSRSLFYKLALGVGVVAYL